MSLRALCLSDVHRDVATARRLGARALAGGIDLLVSAGDLGVDGAHDAAVYETLSRPGLPVLSVPGNHDGGEDYDKLVARLGWTDLNGRVIERDGWWFVGIGLRCWDGVSDAVAPEVLHGPGTQLAKIPRDRLIVVAHVPPYGTLCSRDRKFVDRGSPHLAHWIHALQPVACVCGHVHHQEVVADRIGESLIVNAGAHGFVLAL